MSEVREDPFSVNLAKFFYPYGFHRDKGPHPGIELRTKIRPLFQMAKSKNQPILIELGEMKALYGSFIDGAFGEFIDELKQDFRKYFVFVSEKNPAYLSAVDRVFKRHAEKQFNVSVNSNDA